VRLWVESNQPITPLYQNCYLCLRYKVLPMWPVRTNSFLVGHEGLFGFASPFGSYSHPLIRSASPRLGCRTCLFDVEGSNCLCRNKKLGFDIRVLYSFWWAMKDYSASPHPSGRVCCASAFSLALLGCRTCLFEVEGSNCLCRK
jgi:hypothetical protein